MGARKNLTIGITVNLEHYENLRVEVSGEVENREEADELVGFLDETLARMGRGDPATAERVDSYRRRVLTAGPASVSTDMSQPPPAEKTGDIPLTVYPAEEEKSPVEAPAVAEQPGETEKKKEEPEGVPAAPQGGGNGMVCEKCGNTITAAEQKMSQLFTGKTLCKVCMKKA